MYIITLGTIQKGGIDSVIQGYIDDGLFKNAKHTRIATHAGNGKWSDFLLFILAILKLSYLCATKKEVILHCHLSYKGSFTRKFVFAKLAKFFHQKCIVHLHGSEFKEFFANSNNSTQRRILWLINNVDEFVVLSASWQEYILGISGRKALIINNYVDIKKKELSRETNHILFLGAYIQRKGIYDLIRAVGQLKIDFHLHICGAGEDDQVENLINKLSLKQSITNHGWVNSDQKTALLSQCSLFILPSYNEGLPMVIIEAMACEIPIISTPVGGIPEVIVEGQTGYLVNPGDIDAMANKIVQVLNSDLNVVTQAKKLYVSHFSSSTILPKWLALYATVLNNQGMFRNEKA